MYQYQEATVKSKDQFSLADHVEEIASSRTCFYNNLRNHDESKLESVLKVIDDKKSRSVRRAISGKISNWLRMPACCGV